MNRSIYSEDNKNSAATTRSALITEIVICDIHVYDEADHNKGSKRSTRRVVANPLCVLFCHNNLRLLRRKICTPCSTPWDPDEIVLPATIETCQHAGANTKSKDNPPVCTKDVEGLWLPDWHRRHKEQRVAGSVV